MGDEKKTPPTSLDSAKPQYNLATNNKARTNASKKPLFESKEVGTTKTPKKKED